MRRVAIIAAAILVLGAAGGRYTTVSPTPKAPTFHTYRDWYPGVPFRYPLVCDSGPTESECWYEAPAQKRLEWVEGRAA